MNEDENYMCEVDKYIETLKKCEFIRDEKDVKKLCEKAKEILSKEDNVIYLNSPITVKTYNNTKYILTRSVVIYMVSFTI